MVENAEHCDGLLKRKRGRGFKEEKNFAQTVQLAANKVFAQLFV